MNPKEILKTPVEKYKEHLTINKMARLLEEIAVNRVEVGPASEPRPRASAFIIRHA